MNRSPRRRRTDDRPARRGSTRTRVLAVAMMLAVFGGVVAVTQISSAGTRGDRDRDRDRRDRAVACQSAPDPAASTDPADTGTTVDEFGVRHHWGDGQRGPTGGRDACPQPSAEGTATAVPAPDALEILGDDCSGSDLPPHDGFQVGDRCVSTAFGEVGDADNNPQLMIVSAPDRVRSNEPFTLRISTRNLVRDRFLPAGQGGYYLESSFLNEDGLTRGHFHTACRMLTSNRTAPQPGPVPAFFVATEDGRGGADADEVTVEVPGLPGPGVAQCASWAGDGSHRVPMMQRANQIPAFDVVRVLVTR
ncbi:MULTISPECIES: Pecanex-like protein 1 [unclassified Solwaraspora]|uniref:Pecanex-like protein 1 n=1 Tax=unclassified Solwaraspora TaxID=2627926 RepID=UPI00259B4180|nr:Pecanex-like protein 1 [Solwaraspora sp. WMMA2056]WJK39782.1 Pecanex-like protein 1 [Solwaraspora sp. WMMA2056]